MVNRILFYTLILTNTENKRENAYKYKTFDISWNVIAKLYPHIFVSHYISAGDELWTSHILTTWIRIIHRPKQQK